MHYLAHCECVVGLDWRGEERGGLGRSDDGEDYEEK
jgi:hypothetical protein